jgi:hypothetical protein
MKKRILFLAMMIFVSVFFTGCIMNDSRNTTRIGSGIGGDYKKAAITGLMETDSFVKVWPFISGQIKGLLANNYEIEAPKSTIDLIKHLDELVKREDLTMEDFGFMVGSFVRLEEELKRIGLDRYGVTLQNMIKQAAF